MNAQLYGGINIDLNAGPVRTKYFRGADGKQCAQLVIGEANQSVAISVTEAGPDVIGQLLEAVAELATWTQRADGGLSLRKVA